MKNTMKWLGIIALAAVIGFAFTACGDGDKTSGGTSSTSSTSGGLTITGLGEYDGRYVIASGETPGEELALLAASSYDLNQQSLTGATISNGKATLKVWSSSYNGGGISNYNGNDKAGFQVLIASNATMDNIVAGGSINEVTFTNGKAEVAIENLIAVP